MREVAAQVAGPEATDVVGTRKIAQVGGVVGHRAVLPPRRAVEVRVEGASPRHAEAPRPFVHGPRRAGVGELPYKLKGHRPGRPP